MRIKTTTFRDPRAALTAIPATVHPSPMAPPDGTESDDELDQFPQESKVSADVKRKAFQRLTDTYGPKSTPVPRRLRAAMEAAAKVSGIAVHEAALPWTQRYFNDFVKGRENLWERPKVRLNDNLYQGTLYARVQEGWTAYMVKRLESEAR